MNSEEYLQRRFLEKIVDRSKQRYLRDKKSFLSVVIPFRGHTAWIIPLTPRDMEHKKMLIHMIAAAFAAKGIARFGYFFDGWTAPQIDLSDLKDLPPEEKEAKLKERRAALPADFSKEDFEGRGESISWGLMDENGPIGHTCQMHDSKTHTLLSKAMSEQDVKADMHIFNKLLPMAKAADFKKAGLKKDAVWQLLCDYMREHVMPIVEVDIRH